MVESTTHFIPSTKNCSTRSAEESVYSIELDMGHVGLGALDECALMTLFGSCHSRYLTDGLPYNVDKIVDANSKQLYPAYYMTHLRVPPQVPISIINLWDTVEIRVAASRYGESILESSYELNMLDQVKTNRITMDASSLFILDPAIYRSQDRQVSAPAKAQLRDMRYTKVPPIALQESAKVRSTGFATDEANWFVSEPYRYRLENNRDTSPGHPMMFARFSLLMDLSERAFFREITGNRITEEALCDISLLERKIFYYGNAFAGSELTLHTKGSIKPCVESLWKENPRKQYQYRFSLETEIYHRGECLAIAKSDKVLVHDVCHQSRIQDTKRLFKTIAVEGRDVNE